MMVEEYFMDDVLTHIANRLTLSKDVITYSSLSTACLASCSKIPLHIIITPRWKTRASPFLSCGKYVIKKVTWKREALYDITIPSSVTSLVYQCCRVPPNLPSLPHLLLHHLDIHILDPGNDPGIVDMLRPLTNLETLSITFSRAWGMVSVAGYGAMTQLKRLSLRNATLMIMVDAFPTTLHSLHLEAASIVGFEHPLPLACHHITLHAPECRYIFDALFPPDVVCPELESLDIHCAGMVMCDFLTRMPHLHTCIVSSDSIVISDDFAKPRRLKHLELHCRDCFAIMQLHFCIIERIFSIPTLITTSMGTYMNLLNFISVCLPLDM